MDLKRPFMFEKRSSDLMERCIQLACLSKGVAVGALVADPEGKIVSEGFNDRSSPFLHAEAIALRKAAKKMGNAGLMDCTLFCTLEPCPMCAGSALLFKVGRIVFGAWDPVQGACGSVWDIARGSRGGWKTEVVGGFKEKECSKILSESFKKMR